MVKSPSLSARETTKKHCSAALGRSGALEDLIPPVYKFLQRSTAARSGTSVFSWFLAPKEADFSQWSSHSQFHNDLSIH